MSQFAPVAPIQILETLLKHDSNDLFGNYHLMLAHHCAEQASRFSKLIRDYREKQGFKKLTIIMDNSVVELGGAVDDNMIGTAIDSVAEEFLVNDVVIPCLPDCISDGPGTVEASTDAYHRWIDRGWDHPFMVVLQGKNWDEFVECANHFFMDRWKYRNICYVGIPRVLTKSLGTRERAVRYIQMLAPHVQIHLFGFSDDMVDDFICAKNLGVMGIDSAVPVRHPTLMRPTDFVPARDPKWFEVGICGPIQEQNIRNVRKWVSK